MKNNKHKNNNRNDFSLILVLVLIIAAIFYFENQRNKYLDQIISTLEKKEGEYIKAPYLQGISGYINTEEGFNIDDHIGKNIILIDFWTYSCINCVRTLPYLKSWDEKYRDNGLLIVGVHSPEFEFEKKYENVQRAVQKHDLKYPIVQDNEFQTWRAYGNRYWPRKYLIDIDGFIRYDHIGEGNYEETEKVIQMLLKEKSMRLNENNNFDKEVSDFEKNNLNEAETPEIYFGYDFRRGNFGNEEGFPKEEEQIYKIPNENEFNQVYLEGRWYNSKDYMELRSDTGKILLNYKAKEVNIVAGSIEDTEIDVYLDQQKIKTLTINEEKLYNLIDEETSKERVLIIEGKKEFRIYTFTFG